MRWDYPVYEGIVRQVLRRKASRLVAQSSRKGRAARLVLTQTDYKLIETRPCPVLFIKNARPYSGTVIIAAADPGRLHGKPAALDDGILRRNLPSDVFFQSPHVISVSQRCNRPG